MEPITPYQPSLDGIPSAPFFEDGEFSPSAPPSDFVPLYSSTLQAQPETNPHTQPIYPTFSSGNNEYVCEDLSVNSSDLFNNPGEVFTYIPTNQFDLIGGFEDVINEMPYYLKEFAFQPYLTKISINSPIHKWLKLVSDKFLINYNKTSAAEKINFREQFIAQFLYNVILQHAKTTFPVSEQPFFACLEIALRVHLFNQIVKQEKSEIVSILKANNKFPDNLKEREDGLEALITRYGFFKNPDPCFFYNMISIAFQPHIDSCVSKNEGIDKTEKFIQDTLIRLNLVKPSRTSHTFGYLLRAALGTALLSKQIQHFKEQFQKTGAIAREDFDNAFSKIYDILSENGNIRCDIDLMKHYILVETFELTSNFSFQTLRGQIEKEQTEQLALREPGVFSFLSRSPVRSAEVCLLLANKLATITWAEQQWNGLFPPPQAAVPTNPENQAPLVQNPVETTPGPSAPVIELPAVKSLRPPVPLPTPEPVRIYSTSFDIPLVSYINIACADRLKAAGDDLAVWNSLPGIVQRDALRHCYYLSNYDGKVEAIAARLFKTTTEIEKQLKLLESNHLRAKTRLGAAFIEKGEALLNMYYSSNRDKFYQEFMSLPRENLFYQYVYEMAKASGVHIESWDRHFAEYNWNKITMTNLSVQALERCLHTDS